MFAYSPPFFCIKLYLCSLPFINLIILKFVRLYPIGLLYLEEIYQGTHASELEKKVSTVPIINKTFFFLSLSVHPLYLFS